MIGKVWKRTRDKVGLARADVLMTSFPKCGRTWLRLMIGSALQQHFHVQSQRLLMLEPLAALLHPAIPDIGSTSRTISQGCVPKCFTPKGGNIFFTWIVSSQLETTRSSSFKGAKNKHSVFG